MKLPKTKTLVVVLCLLFASLLKAQAPSWLWAIQNNNFQMVDLKTDQNGNIYICGDIWGSFSIGGNNLTAGGVADIIIAKYDPSGNLLWVRQLGGDLRENCIGMVVDSQGNAWITGIFCSKQFTIGNTVAYNKQTALHPVEYYNEPDIFTAKVSPSGMITDGRTFGTPFEEMVSGITIDSQDNIFICGSYCDNMVAGTHTLVPNVSPVPFFYYDMFVIALDQYGGIPWAKTYGGDHNDFARKIVCDNQDNVIVSGSYHDSLVIGSTTLSIVPFYCNICYFKLDAYGSPLWAKAIQGSNTEIPYSLAADQQNNIVMALALSAWGTVTVGLASYTNSTSDDQSLIAKFDPQGVPLWSRFFHGNNVNLASSLSCDPGDNIYFTGVFTNDSLVMNGVPVFTDSTAIGAVVVKLDPAGNPSWTKHVRTAQNPVYSYATGVQVFVSGNGDLYFSGYAPATACFDADTLQGALWKVAHAKMHVLDVPDKTGVKEASPADGFELYPNPAAGTIHIKNGLRLKRLKIYDLEGRVVFQKTLSEDGLSGKTLDIQALKAGTYFVIAMAEEESFVRKLIVH